ncbi:hypothetical protein [Actinopolyspora erythraea]|uniref:hypothetical protein n=1 Tax=Actinopolyspora erythraea TaxID=414996 RepID=UPI0011854997|nr:hypothetical protein [Actinopolyspora erythraea]
MIDDATTLQLSPNRVLTPSTVPCLISTDSFTIFVEGLPGAAAASAMLRCDYGLQTQWKPVGLFVETPYAFVAVHSTVHVVWFAVDVFVDEQMVTACGCWVLAYPLLAQPKSCDTRGPCSNCLEAWYVHYEQ